MGYVLDALLIILLCSLVARSVARTIAYISLAKDERNERLKEKLLRK